MNVKQVIVLRTDLTMRKGEMIAQGAHAALLAFHDEPGSRPLDLQALGDWLLVGIDDMIKEWLAGGSRKICLGVGSEAELLDIHSRARQAGLRCSLVQDRGVTAFGGVPTYTAIAIGPGPDEQVDAITSNLRLL